MATLVHNEHGYIASNPEAFEPSVAPTPGNLMVISAHTRAPEDVLASISGWTIVETTMASTHPSEVHHVGLSMFYRVAESGDTTWDIAASQCELTYSEWSDVGALTDSTSGVDNRDDASPLTFVCGGTITPDDDALIIGAVSVGLQNDTAVMEVAPSTNVTELDDFDTNGATNGNPGYWSGYRIVTSPSGDYTIGGDITFNSFALEAVGITAVFSAAVAPEPGVWMDWDLDGFDVDTTSDPDAPLARMMPEAGPAGVSDNVTARTTKVDWNRGGSYDHVGQDGPGDCTITLRNEDGMFDPDNAAGALFGKLVPGIPVWVGVIEDTWALSGAGTVKGIFGGRVKTWSPTLDSSGKRVVEVLCEDALGTYRRVPVTVAASLTRSQGTLRQEVLAAAGEDSGRLSLESEPGMLPVSAVDSTSALAVLEELNKASASRHFVTPADTKEDWYDYVVVNKYHALADAVSETIDGEDITDVSGWTITDENRIEQQRAEVQPISVTANNDVVWVGEVPLTVTNPGKREIWATFDDYVFDATLDTNVSEGAISTTLTNFGKTAKIEIWPTGTSAVIGKLQILGRQVVRGDTVQTIAGITNAGALAGTTITSDLIGSVGAAQGLCDFLIWKFSQRLKRPSFTVAGASAATRTTIATRDLYDVIDVAVDRLSVTTRRLEIAGLSGSLVPGRFARVIYQCQETPNQSPVHWFTVGTDTVGGGVPIAPF